MSIKIFGLTFGSSSSSSSSLTPAEEDRALARELELQAEKEVNELKNRLAAQKAAVEKQEQKVKEEEEALLALEKASNGLKVVKAIKEKRLAEAKARAEERLAKVVDKQSELRARRAKIRASINK